MNRGVNRQPLFADDYDREAFVRVVARYKQTFKVKLYHWAWMDNHYHILAEVAHENLRGFVGGLQQAYAQYHHARHQGAGVFWQGRFKSRPVEIGPYLIGCGRYIERNPVRAGLVSAAWDYHWSSAAAYVRRADDGLTDENPYLGKLDEAARQAYAAALMAEIDGEALIRQMEGARPLGSRHFGGMLKTEHGRHRWKAGKPPPVR